jgi:hypothetical protein
VRKLVIVAALITAGCNNQPSVVGKWTGTLSNDQVTAEFQADNSMVVNVKVGTMGADVTGTYQIDSKSLTLNFKSYKLKGVPPSLKDAADSLMSQIVAKPVKGTYHFNNEDELALTYNGTTDVWKREKEAE